MVRGAGKFKQKRGGGRNFSKDMSFDNPERAAKKGTEDNISEEDSDESEEEDSEEEESEEEEEGTAGGTQSEITRAERRALKKKQPAKAKDGEGDKDEDEDLINPNHVQKKLNISDLSQPRELSRREREAKEKQEAADRYWKLHQAGKTDQAKADLARLTKIRAEREAAQAKRKAEAEAKAKEVEQKKDAQVKRKT